MKKIELLILPIVFLITIIIMIFTKDNKIYYLSLGDELSKGINYNNYEGIGYSDFVKEFLEKNNKLKYYTKEFSDTDIRTKDLILKIKNNEEKNMPIQNALKKSDLITISIGLNEIYTKYLANNIENEIYDYIDEMMYNLKDLINLIKKYNNKEIIFIGYYNPKNEKDLDKYILYANNKLDEICNKTNIKYVNIYNIFKSNAHLIYNLNNIYPNTDGYILIAKEVIKSIKKRK